MVSFGQIFLNGLGLSGLYVMVAMGLTLVFGVMRIVNFAHGEFYMIGAYVVWLLYGKGYLPFSGAVAVSVLTVGALSLILQRSIFKPLQGNMNNSFIASVGIMFILQVSVGQIWGLGMDKPVPRVFPQIIHIFDAYMGAERLVIILTSLTLVGGMWLFLHRAKLGRGMRACAQDGEAASLQGISLKRMSAIAMGVGGCLAGVAGTLMAPQTPVNPYMGGQIILKAFIVTIVGGAGSIEGAIVAAFLFGFLDSIIISVADSTIASLVDLSLLFVILVVRPRGLLGREV